MMMATMMMETKMISLRKWWVLPVRWLFSVMFAAHGTKELQWSPPSFYFFHLRWWWIGRCLTNWLTYLLYYMTAVEPLTWKRWISITPYIYSLGSPGCWRPSIVPKVALIIDSHGTFVWDVSYVDGTDTTRLGQRAWLIGSLGSCLGGKERYIIDKHRVSLTLLVTQH